MNWALNPPRARGKTLGGDATAGACGAPYRSGQPNRKFASLCVKIWSFVSAEGWTILFCNPGREKLWPCMWC